MTTVTGRVAAIMGSCGHLSSCVQCAMRPTPPTSNPGKTHHTPLKRKLTLLFEWNGMDKAVCGRARAVGFLGWIKMGASGMAWLGLDS